MAIIVEHQSTLKLVGHNKFIVEDSEVSIMRESIYMSNFQTKDPFMTNTLGGTETITKATTPLGYTTIKDVCISPDRKTKCVRNFSVYEDEDDLLANASDAERKVWQEYKQNNN